MMQRFQTVDDSIDDLKQAFRAFVSILLCILFICHAETLKVIVLIQDRDEEGFIYFGIKIALNYKHYWSKL
jgi:hypothetical protein